MYRVKISGTYYEMGLEQGHSLKEWGFRLPPPDKKTLRFARRCEEVVGRRMPELLDEIRGVADGAE